MSRKWNLMEPAIKPDENRPYQSKQSEIEALRARVAELEALHRTYYNQPFAEACLKAASDERERCIEAAFGWWCRTEGLDYLATDDAHQGIRDALTPTK